VKIRTDQTTDDVLGFIPSPTGVYLVTDYNLEGRGPGEWQFTIHQENTPADRCNHVSRMHATRENHRVLTGEQVEAMWKRAAAMPAQEDDEVAGKFWPPIVEGYGFDRCTHFHRTPVPGTRTSAERILRAPKVIAPPPPPPCGLEILHGYGKCGCND
jgi:hypothetical protein